MRRSVGMEEMTMIKNKDNRFPVIKELKKNKVLFLMMLPGIIILLLNNYLPMFGIMIAFKNLNYAKGFLRSDWVGLKNFEFFIKTPDALIITRNTLGYNLVFIVLQLILPVAVAIAMNQVKNKFLNKFYQSAMLFPYFLSWVTISYITFSFLSIDMGFLNRSILPKFGIDAIQWYNEAKYWPFILPIVHGWKWTGYNAVIYIAAITGIDNELYEASEIDGANKWHQTFKITIPLISSQMIILTLLAIGRIFYADFGLFYQVTQNSGPLYSATNVIDTYVYNALVNTGDIGMSSAAGLYQSVIGFVLVLASNLFVRSINKEKSLF
jgi:putative aldouronate transport system permease protein